MLMLLNKSLLFLVGLVKKLLVPMVPNVKSLLSLSNPIERIAMKTVIRYFCIKNAKIAVAMIFRRQEERETTSIPNDTLTLGKS